MACSLVLMSFFLISACKTTSEKKTELLFWCSNNPREIDFCTALTNTWNRKHPANGIHIQPVPEGQSSEEVILAAVVGKTTPDIYANMWQGSVEMYARAGVLIPLDTLKGFLEFIRARCDSSVIEEVTSADGHIYQVPWKVNPFMTIYNKNLFSENGFTKLPKTYSIYLSEARTFKNNSDKILPKRWFGYTAVKEIWYERLFSFYPLYLAASGGAPLVTNNKAGLTFASALRSILRSDPDIVLIGEIRDHETGQIAVEAALTGHLVLSTLHTNDAPSAITRLTEMGIEPFLVGSALDAVLAQRL
ncbi:MAG: ATPase, T2SS/T4P/T4SS family, partial [Chitinophagales bacterium]